MTTTAAILWCLVSGALFDVHTAPASDSATAFFAEGGGASDFCVLDGQELTLYRKGNEDHPVTVELADGVSVFDVADLDNDGYRDVVSVCGERILLQLVPESGIPAQPRLLFEIRTVFADDSLGPVPRVLVVPFESGSATEDGRAPENGNVPEDRAVLALPTYDALELRTPNGALATSFPYADRIGGLYDNSSRRIPRIGPANALEFDVSGTRTLFPLLPPEVPRGDEPEQVSASMWAGTGESQTWWRSFPLRTNGELERWVFFDRGFRRNGTRVAIVNTERWNDHSYSLRQEEVERAVKRRYPGMVVWRRNWILQDLPDFNSDGYTDLLIMRSPMPKMSVGAMTRVASGRDWPVDLTIHLFNPEKGRHEPKPAASLEFRSPVMWFLHFSPIKDLVTRDFDGDGRTDLACSTSERTFSVWLHDGGFSKEPQFSHTVPQVVEGVVLRTNLDESARTSLVLRSRNAFHLLRAIDAAPAR